MGSALSKHFTVFTSSFLWDRVGGCKDASTDIRQVLIMLRG